MIIAAIARLNLDRPLMVLNRFLIVLKGVIGGSNVSMVGSHLRPEFNGLRNEFYLFVIIPQFPNCLPFMMIKLTILLYLQPLVTVLHQLFPFPHLQQSITCNQVLLDSLIHLLT